MYIFNDDGGDTMTQITFIRHGETHANENGIFSNVTDYELTEEGIKNVGITAVKLKDEVFDVFLYGKRKRVVQTAQIILDTLTTKPKEVIQTEEIDEIIFGDFEGLTADEAMTEYPIEWNEYMVDWQSFTFPNGSNMTEFCLKNKKYIKKILEEYKDKNIAIVGHYGCISAFLIGIEDKDTEEFLNLSLKNANYVTVNI